MSEASALLLAVQDQLNDTILELKKVIGSRYYIFPEPLQSRHEQRMGYRPVAVTKEGLEAEEASKNCPFEMIYDTEDKLIRVDWWPQLRGLKSLQHRLVSYRNDMLK